MMCLLGGQEVKPVRGMFEDGVGWWKAGHGSG